MFEARVKHFRYNESLMARLIAFLRKEATEKEATKKEMVEKEDNDDEEDQQVWPSGCSNDDGPISPIRFPRVKHWFKCPICISTRKVYSSTSKKSSRMNCRRSTLSNSITSLTGCSKQQCVIREDHELDVSCLLELTFDVWWMNNVW
jgi:hypothetical protein